MEKNLFVPRTLSFALPEKNGSGSTVVDDNALREIQRDLTKALLAERAEYAKLHDELAKEKEARRKLEKEVDRERAIRILERRARIRTFKDLEKSIMEKVTQPDLGPNQGNFVDDRPISEMYTPADLSDYYKRCEDRIKNPTRQDAINKFRFGERWKSMIDVPLPVNKIPHPKIVKMRLDQELQRELMEQARYEAQKRRWSKIRNICDNCCECVCLCLCQCGKRRYGYEYPGVGKAAKTSATTTVASGTSD